MSPLASVQRKVCLATLWLLPQENILRLCCHQPHCPGLITARFCFPVQSSSSTRSQCWQSAPGAGFSAGFSRLSQYLSQTEASPSHGPCIPMLRWRLALILVWHARVDPVQGAQPVIPSLFQAALRMVPVLAQENAAPRVRNRTIPSSDLVLGWLSHAGGAHRQAEQHCPGAGHT